MTKSEERLNWAIKQLAKVAGHDFRDCKHDKEAHCGPALAEQITHIYNMLSDEGGFGGRNSDDLVWLPTKKCFHCIEWAEKKEHNYSEIGRVPRWAKSWWECAKCTCRRYNAVTHSTDRLDNTIRWLGEAQAGMKSLKAAMEKREAENGE